MSVPKTIIQHLIVTEEYRRTVFPFLVADYFRERIDKVLFEIIADYVGKYNKFPSVQEIAIELTEKDDVDQIEFDEAKEFLCEVEPDDSVGLDWLVDTTEKFCQGRALELAIQKSSDIILDEKRRSDRNGIPQLLQDALAVSFKTNLGHDFLEDWEQRYDYLHSTVSRIPFHLEYLNKVTNGGAPPKSLIVVLAGTGVGKSMLMCDMAAHNLMDNRNVLYITLELATEMISQRIEANLFDIELDLINTLSKADVEKKIDRLKKRTTGKLIVEEFAPSSAGAAHFRRLLNDLKTKKGFVPDIVYVDYINICISTRAKSYSNLNSYTVVKMIAEELRGIAVDFQVPLITATQTNRGGFASNDLGLEDTAESFGLPATADFMFSISQDEDNKEMGQVVFKQLKNRFGDIEKLKRWIMGVQKSKMRFLELEASAQRTINNDVATEPNRKPKFVSTPAKEKYAKFNKRNPA